jgi:hypothetical protein
MQSRPSGGASRFSAGSDLHRRVRCGYAGTVLLTVLLGASVVLGGCNRDFVRPLPRGYRLARTNPYTVVIVAPAHVHHPAHVHGTAVPPKIVEVGVWRTFVYGRVSASPQSELAALSQPGYFVLDTSTGNVDTGMTESAWRRRLESLGFANPRMVAPESLPTTRQEAQQ